MKMKQPKNRWLFVALLLVTLSPHAAFPQQVANAVDPEKAADIRRLLELRGEPGIVLNTISRLMEHSESVFLMGVPPDRRTDQVRQFIHTMREKILARINSEEIIRGLILAYDKHFTHEQIRKLIGFYKSPVGRHLTEVEPQLDRDLQASLEPWLEQEMAEIVREMEAEFPQLEVSRLVQEAAQALSKDEYDLAVQLLTQAAELDPSQAQTHVWLGNIFARRHLYEAANQQFVERASVEFRQALELDPTSAEALDWLGNLASLRYWETQNPDDLDEARSFFEKHARLQPEDPEPNYWLGVLAWDDAYIANVRMRRDYSSQTGLPLDFGKRLPEEVRKEFSSRYGAIVDDGIERLKRVLELDPLDWWAMAYLNLLYRQKADQAATVEESEKLHTIADSLHEKALATRQQREFPPENPLRPPRPPPPPPPPAPNE